MKNSNQFFLQRKKTFMRKFNKTPVKVFFQYCLHVDNTVLNNKTTICLNFLPSGDDSFISKTVLVQSVHAVYCSNDKSVSDNPAYQLHWNEPDSYGPFFLQTGSTASLASKCVLTIKELALGQEKAVWE